MLNVIDLSVVFPARAEKLVDLADDLSLSRNQIRMFDRFFGFETFHCDHFEPLDTLLSRATEGVMARNADHRKDLRHAVHCHTLLSTHLFGQTVSDPCGPACLQDFATEGVEVFSATMNHCATGLSMLGLLDHLLEPGALGLILIGEKAFHPAIRVIENTTIMGEAATAVLVGHVPGPFEVMDTFVRHAPQFWKNTGLRGENYLEGFDSAYLQLASSTLSDALDQFGRSPDDLRWIMPHNVNVPSWYQVADDAGFSKSQLRLSTIGCYGHCFGVDPFLNLWRGAQDGVLVPGDELLLFSIGLGATASCALLRVTDMPLPQLFQTNGVS
ncbi:3-oxoacyl-[acyl-carrier-protein] synthase III C-terminal domain-containing protein [Phaeobacter sp.]|uniref:3-oxoacyl-[acyl-carrier-protein] synthase III C-terminal domain-containing protein n=1 Tax=Phaeobacter sp. TaxID=1902409 RepID=UPI0025D47F33|nr:3-oxoacyl-[acyl-carrier-protein] synthase III C-terminal domain-containing protein [Phaeobacter sp.]